MSGRRAKWGRRAVHRTVAAFLYREEGVRTKGWGQRDSRELGFLTWDAYLVIHTSREWGRPKAQRWHNRWSERWSRRRLRRELARQRAARTSNAT